MTTLMQFTGRPYEGLSEGDIVELVGKTEKYQDPTSSHGFTWPEYTTVKTADGRIVIGHSYRFKVKDETTT